MDATRMDEREQSAWFPGASCPKGYVSVEGRCVDLGLAAIYAHITEEEMASAVQTCRMCKSRQC